MTIAVGRDKGCAENHSCYDRWDNEIYEPFDAFGWMFLWGGSFVGERENESGWEIGKLWYNEEGEQCQECKFGCEFRVTARAVSPSQGRRAQTPSLSPFLSAQATSPAVVEREYLMCFWNIPWKEWAWGWLPCERGWNRRREGKRTLYRTFVCKLRMCIYNVFS